MRSNLNTVRRWTLALAIGICAAAPLPGALAENVRIGSAKLPDNVRQTMDRESSGSRDVDYYKDENNFTVHHTLPSGLRISTRVRRDGKVVRSQLLKSQPVLREREARREFARYRDQLASREVRQWTPDDGRAFEEGLRDLQEDREQLAAERQHLEAERQRKWDRRREEEARHDRARRLDDRDYDDYFGSRRFDGRLDERNLPSDVRRALRDATREAQDAEYCRYAKGGRDFYCVQFTTPAGRRVEVTADEEGRLVDRVLVTDYAGAHGDIRSRDDEYDRGQGWHRSRVRTNRERLPRDARDALDEQTLGASDVDYYRIDDAGRTVYAARYTTAGGRRIESRADERGRSVGRVELYDPSDRPGSTRHPYPTH